MRDDPDWLEKIRASGKRLEHFMRCAEAELGLPNVHLVKQARAEFHDLCTPDRIALLIDAATAKDAAEAEAVTWRRALVLAHSLTHSHGSQDERRLGDQLEAALSSKDDPESRMRIGLLERALTEIFTSPDVEMPGTLRERIEALVDVAGRSSVGDPLAAEAAGED